MKGGGDLRGFCSYAKYIWKTTLFLVRSETYLRVMDVAVEPAVERAQFRADQDEGRG